MMQRRGISLIVAGLLAAIVTPGLAAGATEADAGITTIFIVRHAEKKTGESDPSLSEPGVIRADLLARMLSDSGMDAIYSSQFRRTRETAQAVAELLGLEVRTEPIETGDIPGWAQGFAQRLRSTHAGQSVLVTGHSNTVPLLVDALGAGPAPPITESEYDDLFVVLIEGDNAHLLHLHYGASSPDPGP